VRVFSKVIVDDEGKEEHKVEVEVSLFQAFHANLFLF
jgi:hypothetical protein